MSSVSVISAADWRSVISRDSLITVTHVPRAKVAFQANLPVTPSVWGALKIITPSRVKDAYSCCRVPPLCFPDRGWRERRRPNPLIFPRRGNKRSFCRRSLAFDGPIISRSSQSSWSSLAVRSQAHRKQYAPLGFYDY